MVTTIYATEDKRMTQLFGPSAKITLKNPVETQ